MHQNGKFSKAMPGRNATRNERMRESEESEEGKSTALQKKETLTRIWQAKP
jgi:hypothetical protein